MGEIDLRQIFLAQMNMTDFNRISQFIYKEFGIKMPPIKKTMLQSRLQKRLRALNIPTYKEYIDYLFSKEGKYKEVTHMIDVVSTNKTDFFREPSHFDFMSDHLLPDFIKNNKTGRYLRLWSAGCSSGEEPYTLSMVLSEFSRIYQNINFSILATDISTQMLKLGVNAIYKDDRVAQIPLELKRKYFLRSKDSSNKTVRIIPYLRRLITFQRLNFMDSNYNVPDNFDVIFCRNVLIYFDRPTQEMVINRLCGKLRKGGFFFLGHSESIANMKVPLRHIKPTIFIKK